MQGWIKLHRSIQENEFYFSERFTKAQAWIDLILLANHKPATIFLRGVEVNLSRGELARSQVTLASRWKWNERTVNKFLKMLEKREMIHIRSTNVTTIVSIRNYNLYQDSTEQSTVQETEQSTSRIQTDKNDNNEKNVVVELIAFLNNNKIDFDEKSIRLRVPKMITDYGKESFKSAVNEALESWRRNRNTGNFLSYMDRTLHNNYQRIM